MPEHAVVVNLEFTRKKIYEFLFTYLSEPTLRLIFQPQADGTHAVIPLMETDEEDVKFFKELLITYKLVQEFFIVFYENAVTAEDAPAPPELEYKAPEEKAISSSGWRQWLHSTPTWMSNTYQRLPSPTSWIGAAAARTPKFITNSANAVYTRLPARPTLESFKNKISNGYTYRLLNSVLNLKKMPGLSVGSQEFYSNKYNAIRSYLNFLKKAPSQIASLKFIIRYTQVYLKNLNLEQVQEQIKEYLDASENNVVRQLIEDFSGATTAFSDLLTAAFKILDRINSEQTSFKSDVIWNLREYNHVLSLFFAFQDQFYKIKDRGLERLIDETKMYVSGRLSYRSHHPKFIELRQYIQNLEINNHLKPGTLYLPLRRLGTAVFLNFHDNCPDVNNFFSLISYQQHVQTRAKEAEATGTFTPRLNEELQIANQALEVDKIYKDDLFQMLQNYDVASWLVKKTSELTLIEKTLFKSLLNTVNFLKTQKLTVAAYKEKDAQEAFDPRTTLITLIQSIARNRDELALCDEMALMFYLNHQEEYCLHATRHLVDVFKDNILNTEHHVTLRRMHRALSHCNPQDLLTYWKQARDSNNTLARQKLEVFFTLVLSVHERTYTTFTFNDSFSSKSFLCLLTLMQKVESPKLKQDLLIYLQTLGALDRPIAKELIGYAPYQIAVKTTTYQPHKAHYDVLVQAQDLYLNAGETYKTIIEKNQEAIKVLHCEIYQEEKVSIDYSENLYAFGKLIRTYQEKCLKDSRAAKDLNYLYQITYDRSINLTLGFALLDASPLDTMLTMVEDIRIRNQECKEQAQTLSEVIQHCKQLNREISNIIGPQQAAPWIKQNNQLCANAVKEFIHQPQQTVRELCMQVLDTLDTNKKDYKNHCKILGSKTLYRIIKFFSNLIGIQTSQDKVKALQLNHSLFTLPAREEQQPREENLPATPATLVG